MEGRGTKHVSVDIYSLNLFIEHSGEHWWEQNIFCSFTTPQVFWQSSAPGALSTLVTSVVLYSLTRATLMSPGNDKTHICGYTLWIYSLSLLENIDENRIFFVRSPHHKHFGKAQHSGDISCSLLVNPSHTDESSRVCGQHILVNIYIYIDQNFISLP